MIEIKFKWGGKGYLLAKDVQKVINVKVKVFFGKREVKVLQLPIESTISDLFNELKTKMKDELAIITNPRFYYPMGTIQHLDSQVKTLSDYQIPDNAQILMIAKKPFQWANCDRKPDTLELTNKNLTVKVIKSKDPNKQKSGNAATILGNTAMTSGKHYWTIKLDYLNHNDDSLSVGICLEDLDRSSIPQNQGVYWGFQPIICQKFSPDHSEEYGKACVRGDTIGVCLEFKNMYGTLQFYRNGTFLGIAERNLVGSFYPAVSFFAPDSSITLSHSAKPTPN